MSSVSDNLFGAYTHKLDPKNRIAIPAEWRPSEGCALLLLSGRRLDLPTVKAYTREKFQQLIDKIETTPGYTEAQIDLSSANYMPTVWRLSSTPKASC